MTQVTKHDTSDNDYVSLDGKRGTEWVPTYERKKKGGQSRNPSRRATKPLSSSWNGNENGSPH